MLQPRVARRPLLRFVRLSSARAGQGVRHGCSFRREAGVSLCAPGRRQRGVWRPPSTRARCFTIAGVVRLMRTGVAMSAMASVTDADTPASAASMRRLSSPSHVTQRPAPGVVSPCGAEYVPRMHRGEPRTSALMRVSTWHMSDKGHPGGVNDVLVMPELELVEADRAVRVKSSGVKVTCGPRRERRDRSVADSGV